MSSRKMGTNPVAMGTNPRALGLNPRAIGTNPKALQDKLFVTRNCLRSLQQEKNLPPRLLHLVEQALERSR